MSNEFEFGTAISILKSGRPVARKGWNGKGMFLYYVPAAAYPPTTDIAKRYFGGKDVKYTGYIAIKSVNDTVTPWLPSQTDVLSEDWYVVEGI